MKQALALLCLSISISACSHKQVVTAPDCYIPPPPVYTPLNADEHIASPGNIERIMHLVIDMQAHIKRQETAIKCLSGFLPRRATEGD